MARLSPLIEHLYRRAGFGLSAADRLQYSSYSPVRSPRTGRLVASRTGGGSYRQVVDSLLVFNQAAGTEVDASIGKPGFAGITTVGPFSPNTDIGHARQRWLFRMVHSAAPLQEKMALFWHHHFATAVSKISGVYGAIDSTRLMAARAYDDPVHQQGQIELFRLNGLGSFRDLLIRVAQDPAMLVWLDGVTNLKAQPQENFGRELMELFTFGVDHYVEADVYAAARVFTGWNLQFAGVIGRGNASYRFFYNAAQHDTGAKDFSFPIYLRGAGRANRIPARSADAGMQDGIDLIHALAYHPETARRMARRLWTWFVSETEVPPDSFVRSIARVYLNNSTSMRAVVRAVLMSPEFQDPRTYYKRYAWPVEFAVRSLKEVGHLGFSVDTAAAALVNMGQQLFEPPDVAGWDIGPLWFSTGAMLARMNFASQLATNQKVALREAARPFKATPESLVGFVADTLTLPALAPTETTALTDYIKAGGAWTGSETQLLNKTAGVFHLVAGSGEYKFV